MISTIPGQPGYFWRNIRLLTFSFRRKHRHSPVVKSPSYVWSLLPLVLICSSARLIGLAAIARTHIHQLQCGKTWFTFHDAPPDDIALWDEANMLCRMELDDVLLAHIRVQGYFSISMELSIATPRKEWFTWPCM